MFNRVKSIIISSLFPSYIYPKFNLIIKYTFSFLDFFIYFLAFFIFPIFSIDFPLIILNNLLFSPVSPFFFKQLSLTFPILTTIQEVYLSSILVLLRIPQFSPHSSDFPLCSPIFTNYLFIVFRFPIFS